MLHAAKRLALGVTLIAAASGILLLSDPGHRAAASSSVRRVAILQHASTSFSTKDCMERWTRSTLTATLLQVIHDVRRAEKRRLRRGDLRNRFEEIRRAEDLDEPAAGMLQRLYV